MRPKTLNEMYNEDIKLDFLEESYPAESSRASIAYTFYNSKNTEEMLGKDIFNFNIEDIGRLLDALNSKTRKTVQRNVSILTNYIGWSIEKGYRAASDDPFEGIDTSWFERFISEEQFHFSKQEMDNILLKVKNAQDRVLIRLIFEGAHGKGLSEILNLTKEDIDWENNLLYLTDDKYGKREKPLKVSDECLEDLKEASEQTAYVFRNGMSGKIEEMPLYNSGYIVKNTVRNTADSDIRTRYHTAHRRIVTIGEVLNIPNFIPSVIRRSGMIYEGYKLFKKYGENFMDNYYPVLDKYGRRKVMIAGKLRHNVSSVADYVNIDDIMDIYNID